MRAALALDVGTSSVRALAVDAATGRVVRRLARAWSAPGAAHDVETVWAGIVEVLDGLDAWLEARRQPALAGGVSVFWHSVLLADADGVPCTPLYGWSDVGAPFVAGARRLAHAVDAAAVRRRVGAPVHPSFPAAKAVALLDRATDRSTLRLLGLEDLIARRLWGRLVKSVSLASGTGMWDALAQTWDGEVLAALGLGPEQLASVDTQPLRAEPWGQWARRRWPRLGAVPWTLPQGDGALANVGMDATGAVWGATVGTSAALRHLGPARRVGDLPASLFRYVLGPDREVVGGALSGAGNLLAWLARRERVRLADLDGEMVRMEPGAQGVLVVPHLWGERSPGWPVAATGGIVGLRADTPAAVVVRAGIDALGAGLARVARDTGAACGTPRAVRAGGRVIARSTAVAQMAADALDAPVDVWHGWEESSALGASRLALSASGTAAWPVGDRIGERYLPRPGGAQAYEALAARIDKMASAGAVEG